jgi:hypothetical protein
MKNGELLDSSHKQSGKFDVRNLSNRAYPLVRISVTFSKKQALPLSRATAALVKVF